MKTILSLSWRSSKQRRKQRKYRYNAPLHIKHKLLSAHLSKELIKKYKKRSFPVRKDDFVKITRGQYKGKTGKVIKVFLNKNKVHIDGIQRTKINGSKVYIPIHVSNLQIFELNLSDKLRIKSLERK